jgi:hypothetical protein
MASTLTVQNTLNWAQMYLKNRPLAIGVTNEPAMTIANTVLQTIVGPPFCWPWNRNSLTLTAVSQDTIQSNVADFGFIEKASAQDTTGIYQLKVENSIATSSDSGRPTSIAVQSQVPGTGTADNVTFRVQPVPTSSSIVVIYQKKPTLFTAPSGTWSPIPDQLSYIYNYGFLALSMAFADDTRFPIFNQKFISHLLGASEGLTEMEKNIFLGNWMTITGQTQSVQLNRQQGYAARGQ